MGYRRRLWFVVVGASAAALALIAAACGGSDSSYSSPTQAPAAPTAAATQPAAAAPTAQPTAAATTPEAGGAPGAEVMTRTTSLGMVLTDAAEMTLYTFDNDTTPGKSACNGGCATNWPPMTTAQAAPPTVAGAAATFSVIMRDDGTMQVAYGGKPLYRFAGDKAAGDTNGDGVAGIWHAAKP